MDYLNIQEEKAAAMNRYLRLQNITKMRRVLEIVVVLGLLSWSSTRLPFVLNLASQFLVKVYKYLINPGVTFVIGNAIVVAVVYLSRRNAAGNSTEGNDADAFEFCGEVVPPPSPPTLAAETEGIEAETAFVDKEMVVSENVVTDVQCVAVTAAEEGEKKVIRRRVLRTQSEKLTKREHSPRSAQGKILRRSETVVVSSDERRAVATSFKTVDSLSNEDFNRTVEDVIAQHRRSLSEQRMYDNE